MLEGILKKDPKDQQLFYIKESDENSMADADSSILLQDNERLVDRGITANNAKAQSPARLGLCFKLETGSGFEQLDITPYSSPPPLPDIMKATPAAGDANSGDGIKH